jgi:hypothetical protein
MMIVAHLENISSPTERLLLALLGSADPSPGGAATGGKADMERTLLD